MAKIGLIRCEKNENRCPLTGCFQSLENSIQGFEGYDTTKMVGVFTCRCPGDRVVDMAEIMKSKGADVIHFCTCSFAHKEDGKWVLGQGFCENIDDLAQQIADKAAINCIKGSAHLPEGYQPEKFYK
jgi:predicted metal-binding protein